MMEDRFLENDPVPLFLADPLDEAEQSRVRKVVSSDLFRKAVLGLAAAATALTIIWVVKAIAFRGITASEASVRAPRDSVIQAAPPALQSPALQSKDSAQASDNVQASPAAPPADDLLAAFKAAVESQAAVENEAEAYQPATDAVLDQFKAWAAEEGVQAQARQAEPPPPLVRSEAVQAARAESVPSARADIVPLPKRRPAHVERAAPAHEPPPQGAPSLLRQLGFRN